MSSAANRWWSPWSRHAAAVPGEDELAAQRRQLAAKTDTPVFWLLGKSGAGKTSIIRQLTGATSAEIGNGFRPQTRTAAQFDFPSTEAPLLRFLDTRGLGEAHYDATADIAAANAEAHVVLVVVRCHDFATDELLRLVRELRTQRPQRPILLALTCLHELLGGQDLSAQDPFAEVAGTPISLPVALQQVLDRQRALWGPLVSEIVPIDLTQPEEGFANPAWGADRLQAQLVNLLPEALGQAVLRWQTELRALRDATEKLALPWIISCSTLSATAAATPWPLVEIPVVMGLQWYMVAKLARLYQQEWKRDVVWGLIGALGGRILARFAMRAPLKLIPVAGQVANSALAYAYTYSLGKATCWYFSQVKLGYAPTREEFATVWNERLEVALSRKEKEHGKQSANGG